MTELDRPLERERADGLPTMLKLPTLLSLGLVASFIEPLLPDLFVRK